MFVTNGEARADEPADFIVRNFHGSIVILAFETEAAKAWVDDELDGAAYERAQRQARRVLTHEALQANGLRDPHARRAAPRRPCRSSTLRSRARAR